VTFACSVTQSPPDAPLPSRLQVLLLAVPRALPQKPIPTPLSCRHSLLVTFTLAVPVTLMPSRPFELQVLLSTMMRAEPPMMTPSAEFPLQVQKEMLCR